MKVVVFTCDRCSSWLIPIFSHFYKKNWPDNPYQTEFVTETKEINVNGVKTFCAGKIPWADMAIKYLNSIKDDNFLLLLDDYILDKPVKTNIVLRAERFCVGNIGVVHLAYRPVVDPLYFDFGSNDFKEYPPVGRNTASTTPAIWQREFFLNILKSGESMWQFEINGSKRIPPYMKRIISTKTPAISYPIGGYMRRRKTVPSAVKWVEENW